MKPSCLSACVLLLAGILPASSLHAAAVIRMQPEFKHALVGTTFSIDIVANAALPLVGWGLDLSVANTAVARRTTTPPAIGPSWSGAASLDGDNLAALAYPDPVSGSGVLLASVEMEAVAVGRTNVTLGVTPGDLSEGFALSTVGSFDAAQFQGGQIIVVQDATDVPVAPVRFALRGARPNPSLGSQVTVAFSLSDARPAEVQLLDLAGRMLATAQVGGLGEGSHISKLSALTKLGAGIYWVRLVRGNETLSAKFVVLP